MPPFGAAYRFFAALILMGLLAAAPAKAEIETCAHATESYARHSAPSITIPGGRIEDKEAAVTSRRRSGSLSCCRLTLKPRSRTQNQLSWRSSASFERR
jgi:hypothetical protein